MLQVSILAIYFRHMKYRGDIEHPVEKEFCVKRSCALQDVDVEQQSVLRQLVSDVNAVAFGQDSRLSHWVDNITCFCTINEGGSVTITAHAKGVFGKPVHGNRG